ncbi:MAG: cytochrome c [Sphingomicrobium sp.]
MRIALLAMTAVALLGACRQSADNAAANTAAPKNAQVLPITDENAAMTAMHNSPEMQAMMQSMQAAPMAHDAAMQRMHERHDGMERIGKSFKAAGRTLKSGSPDLAVVRSSAATIALLASKTPTWFPAGTGPDIGKTGAKPAIWQKPADFVAKDTAMRQAAAAFDAAAKSGDMAAIGARFGALGKTCKACHDDYRSEMHH